MSAITAYDQHAAGASRCAAIIGLIPADHPQLWTRDRLITRAAEQIREQRGISWENACIQAERVYSGLCMMCGNALRLRCPAMAVPDADKCRVRTTA